MELRKILERAFEAYREPLKNVTAFKYLRRVLTAGDYDWLAVLGKLGKAIKSWGRLLRILSQEGTYPKVSGHFLKVVSQAVLLFGEDTWVLTPRMERSLDIFQNRVARRITRRNPRRRGMIFWHTHHWRRQWGKHDYRGSGNPSQGGRTRSCSILRCDQFWTPVSVLVMDFLIP